MTAIEDQGELVRISHPVSARLEIAEIADRVMKGPGGGPALLFEHVLLDDGDAPSELIIRREINATRGRGGRCLVNGRLTPLARLKRIGDCLAPSTIAAAVYAGHKAARGLDEAPVEGVPFKRELPAIEG